MSVIHRYQAIQEQVSLLAEKCGRDPSTVKILAVSKHHAWEEAAPLYEEAGCRDFGENRVQELMTKIDQAPSDVKWHLIGTLQKNKVKSVIGRVALIHSVDSLELAQTISHYSQQAGVTTSILLQANTSGEASKHGLTADQWLEMFETVKQLPGIHVEGVMTMAPFVEDEQVIRSCFRRLRELRDSLHLKHLSMGMTHDYPIAIEEGATIVRIGTAIFG